MRKIICASVFVLAAAGCREAAPTPTPGQSDGVIQIRQSPSPFTEISSGPVSALIPDDWHPVAADGGYGGGFFASPRPNAWARMDGSVEGLSATWVDATRIGVPSDYYYLAATGPVLSHLTHSAGCDPISHEVFADHRPAFFAGEADSAGDYVARGEGTCSVHGVPTRWAYFVASPGFGPVRRMGIPSSGLYVVVAVIPDSRRAHGMLRTILDSTRFGNAGPAEMAEAASAA